MILDTIFDRMLILATLLCTLNAGFLFAFAVVIMPGLKSLNDGEFIRAFQAIDGVIQRGQPLFILVWLGSAVALLIATILGFSRLDQPENGMLIIACIAYFIGIQISTVKFNIPLNNTLQKLDTLSASDTRLSEARADFEASWNKWNKCRTLVAMGVSILLIIVV